MKSILKFFPLLALLLCLGACSSSGDMKELLRTVPAESPLVVTMNVDEALDQLEFSNKDGKTSFCKELNDLLKQCGAEKKDINKVGDCIDLTNRVGVMFFKGNDVFFTFTVKNASDFEKWYEAVTDKEFEDETDGFRSASNRTLMIKGKQVWVSSSKIDTDDLLEWLDMKSEDSFAGAYPKTTSTMCEGKNTACFFVNLDSALSMLRTMGETELVAQIQVVRGVAFKDAEYLSLVGSITADGTESVLSVLNDKEEPAEFLLPAGKINTAAMNKINNDAAVVFSIDFSPELVKKITSMADKYMGNLQGQERTIYDLLTKLQGTTSISFDGEQSMIISMGFSTPEAASEAGQLLSTMGMPMEFSTAGNYLIARTPGAKAGGSAPKDFDGNFMGLQMNYASPAAAQFMNGFDFSKMGKVVLLLGPNDKGLQLKSVWKHKEPLKFIVSLVGQAIEMQQNAYSGFAEPEPDYWDDTVEVVDEIAIEEESTYVE